MRVFVVTVAYCPAGLLARCLTLYDLYHSLPHYRHIVIDGHYPINEKKNSHDIKLICEAMPWKIELLDPGKNLGSAQSQNWCLNQLDIEPDDVFINLDPDSACLNVDWDEALLGLLKEDPNCVLVSCMAPMVERYLGETKLEPFWANGYQYAKAPRPTPFNLSMWRYSFIKEIGGIPQMGIWWGETEAPFYAECQRRGKYHAYCLDVLEDEQGKFMQDRQHNEYKDLHMRTAPPNQFLGSFEEYLRWKAPELLNMDTCKDLTNHNHP